MREGEKTFRKNIEPIFEKVNRCNQIKKNNGQISEKVNEGNKMKKTSKWKQLEKYFLSPEINFFSNVFYLQKSTFFFWNQQELNARAEQKKQMFCW